VPTGHFTIFFPQDAHAPLAAEGALRKAVAKIAVDW
jgi:beta-galactosidase beta subunit